MKRWGNIIEAFASDEAMVKVGTVIDPDMRDELHVTVVVTGLDPRVEKPVKVVDNTNTLKVNTTVPVIAPASEEAQDNDYRQYDRPTAQRRSGGAATASKPQSPRRDGLLGYTCVFTTPSRLIRTGIAS